MMGSLNEQGFEYWIFSNYGFMDYRSLTAYICDYCILICSAIQVNNYHSVYRVHVFTNMPEILAVLWNLYNTAKTSGQLLGSPASAALTSWQHGFELCTHKNLKKAALCSVLLKCYIKIELCALVLMHTKKTMLLNNRSMPLWLAEIPAKPLWLAVMLMPTILCDKYNIKQHSILQDLHSVFTCYVRLHHNHHPIPSHNQHSKLAHK